MKTNNIIIIIIIIIVVVVVVVVRAPCIVDSMKNKVNKNLLFQTTERNIRLMGAADTFSNLTPRDDLNTPSMR